MKDYTLHKDTPITPEEKRRITSFHAILIDCSAELGLITNVINTSAL